MYPSLHTYIHPSIHPSVLYEHQFITIVIFSLFTLFYSFLLTFFFCFFFGRVEDHRSAYNFTGCFIIPPSIYTYLTISMTSITFPRKGE